jgi:hypothetical protein
MPASARLRLLLYVDEKVHGDTPMGVSLASAPLAGRYTQPAATVLKETASSKRPEQSWTKCACNKLLAALQAMDTCSWQLASMMHVQPTMQC